MPTITINLPETALTRVKDAFASAYKWDGTGTKGAFAKKMVIRYIKEVVKGQEREVSVDAARQAAEAAHVDPDVT